MSWPRDPFVSDGSYTTPLPQQPCEAVLWRAVTSLYQYSSLEALLKVSGPVATAAPASPEPADCKPASAAEAPHAGAPEEVEGVAEGCSRVSATSSPALATRDEVMVRRSAFIAAADTAMPLRTPSPSLAPSVTSPLAMSVAANLENPPVLPLPRSPNAPTVASRLPRRRSAGSWSDKGDSLASSPTTAYIRAACRRVLEPVQALLTQFNADKLHVGASVVDLAVQHPLPCLRVELVQLLLMFKRWNWSMCAPVAVAAGVGDMDVLTRLLSVEELEPNLGFPLRVAVQCHQNEQVLPFLVSHHRIKPNYGSAFYAAVVTGNTEAMYILGAAAGVNVNRFASSEGTSALLYALRQFLMCSSIAAAAQQPSPTTASAALHSRKPQRGITPPSSPLPSTAEQGVVTISPFLAGAVSGGARAPAKHGFRSLPSGDADGSGAASYAAAAAAPYVGAPSASVSSKAMGPLWQRDKTLFSNASAAWAMDDGHEGVTAVAHEEDRDEKHGPSLRQDTATHRLRTAQHWKAVLLYLLDHPAIEVNAGFYTTPLQIAVLAGNVEVVAWLLQHPHLCPNRLPKAASVLRDSHCLVQRQSLSEDALKRLIATPVEMAVQLHQVEAFKLLVRDQRVRMPVRLTMDLERLAWSAEAIPYLTILAQHRADWEGWGWRSRRQCLLVATAASCVVALCSWAVWCAWYDSLQACGVVLVCTYAVQVVMTVILSAWEAYMVRTTSSAAQQPAAKPTPVLAAFVQHLVPAWSGAWQCSASAVLLLCPGMVPVLDLLCAWSLYKIHRSRRPLQTAARAGGAAPAASPQHRPFGPTDSPTSHAGLSHASRERVDRARPQSMWFSSTARGWSGLSVASNVSGHDSFTEAPCTANFSLKESFSCPRPATVCTRRQVLTGGGVQRRLHTGGGSPASAVAEGAASASAHRVIACTAGHATASDGEFVFRTVSPIVNNSITFSPSVGRRDPWVVPGRPSRFAVSTEYHAPDLTLRALAYVTYDWLLVAPRLLLSIVGIFIFMHMVFPSSPPASSSPPAAMIGNGSVLGVGRETPPRSATLVSDGTATHSIFTLHHYARPLSAVPTGAAAITVEKNPADLPHFTTMMGLVGLCGLVASIVSGAVLLAMATSLRTITTQSFFASPKGERSADAGRGGDGLVLRHCEWDGPRRAADSRAD